MEGEIKYSSFFLSELNLLRIELNTALDDTIHGSVAFESAMEAF